MGLLDFFLPKLTEEVVTIAEQKATESAEQLELMRRYAKATGQRRVNLAETAYVWRLGAAVSDGQIQQFNDQTNIESAQKSAAIATKNSIDSYAKSLILRGTK